MSHVRRLSRQLDHTTIGDIAIPKAVFSSRLFREAAALRFAWESALDML